MPTLILADRIGSDRLAPGPAVIGEDLLKIVRITGQDHGTRYRGCLGGDEVVLRSAGARFGLLHGSRAAGSPRADSDVDVAAWWPSHPPSAFEVLVPPARVRWTATTCKIYADEQPRLWRSHLEFAEAVRRGR